MFLSELGATLPYGKVAIQAWCIYGKRCVLELVQRGTQNALASTLSMHAGDSRSREVCRSSQPPGV